MSLLPEVLGFFAYCVGDLDDLRLFFVFFLPDASRVLIHLQFI